MEGIIIIKSEKIVKYDIKLQACIVVDDRYSNN